METERVTAAVPVTIQAVALREDAMPMRTTMESAITAAWKTAYVIGDGTVLTRTTTGSVTTVAGI